jgi:NAD(P)-dependent dehydrogenase (short-subunit alcohol dehydrogenase family)
MSTMQAPLGSGFGASSTADDVIADIDLTGRTAIVTGGYSGLGLETARVLAKAGAHVVVPARSPGRARAALAAMEDAEVEELDLMDPRSIDGFAERFLASGRPLSILVNSAGIMATPLARDARGYESQFSTNHLGHFQLVSRLWPALQRAGNARVVSVSSGGHKIAGIDFDDVNFERREYEKWTAYGQSKTANALFAVGLDTRGSADGIRAFSLHPGSVLGPLARHLTADEIASFGVHDADGNVIVDPDRDLKSVAQGAATSVWCATSPQLAGLGGVYCENCDIARLAPEDSDESGGVRPWAVDADLADRLWQMSERMTSMSRNQ